MLLLRWSGHYGDEEGQVGEVCDGVRAIAQAWGVGAGGKGRKV